MNSTNEKEYTVERLTQHNLADVAKLYTAVYGRNPGIDFFKKKYNTAYTGKECIGVIAYNNERTAVGYYGVIPCCMQYENTVVLSAQSADTMTHPQYRFKGLFVELSNRTFEICRAENIRFVFGFPNQNSAHGAIHKLGWQLTDTMNCFSIPVQADFFSKLLRKISWLRLFHQDMILKKYMTGLPSISNSVLKDGYAGLHRSPNYFAWKTFHTTSVIRIGESLVWLKIGTALFIGDMEVEPGDFDNTMFQLHRLASVLGLTQIVFQASPGTALHDLFAAKYTAVPSFPVLFQDWESGIDIKRFKFCFADIDIF